MFIRFWIEQKTNYWVEFITIKPRCIYYFVLFQACNEAKQLIQATLKTLRRAALAFLITSLFTKMEKMNYINRCYLKYRYQKLNVKI
ncbi:DUF1816 domain-containing protein [Scytonema millei VB511283]|uniref:DUF1816 domain-containing protein n=1 Tax=Scytonema millei VB511283 TaxID=1245923 RepID=A0A9X5E550_9CYAN|nr:DUF1816 domain-containing protein [Scytonema millei VB511283]